MPTGYTYKVQEGTVVDVKDYILDCARNFGALIHMREDSSFDIKYREVSDYHLKELNKAYQKLEEIKKMTDEDINDEIEKRYENSIESMNRILDKKKEYRERYLNMLEKVNKWNAPTDEHLNLKEFAIKQLQESLKWDCDDTYIKREIPRETASEYRSGMIKYYLREIEYHSNNYQKEIEAAEKVNKWIDDLIDSFK